MSMSVVCPLRSPAFGEPAGARVRRVAIVAGETVVGAGIAAQVRNLWPDAGCHYFSNTASAESLVRSGGAGLLVVQADGAEGDALDLLAGLRPFGVPTVVLVRRPSARLALSLRALAIAGVCDGASGDESAVGACLAAVGAGGCHWPKTMTDCLCGDEVRLVRHQLAPREQLFLALAGAGYEDGETSELLGVTLATTRSLSRDVRNTLGVRGHHALLAAAARLGFTRFGRAGLAPFGLGVLIDEYYRLSRRPALLPPALLAMAGQVGGPASNPDTPLAVADTAP